MTAANVPQSGRKIWVKVECEGVWRKFEWNTATCSFVEFEAKIRSMFHIDSKAKLLVLYCDKFDWITTSTDEEITTALQLLQGDLMEVRVEITKRKKRSPFTRTLREAKNKVRAVRPQILAAQANARALCAQAIRSLPCPCTAVHQVATAARNACGRVGPAAYGCLACVGGFARWLFGCRKLVLALLFLALAFGAMRHTHGPQRWRGGYPHGQQSFSYNNQPLVTIIAASYGGQDVTERVQDYYNRHGYLVAHNSVFGDPMVGTYKYLHVVFQARSPQTGLIETFAQSIPEAHRAAPQQLRMEKDNICSFSESAVRGTKSYTVLGALYEGGVVTCEARRLAHTGQFSDIWMSAGNVVNKHHFPSVQPSRSNGVFTMVYLKNNKLEVFTGREGSTVKLW
jgi:hypothetical protein